MGLYLPWSTYSKFNARWNGRRDGKISIPPLEQEQHAPYELELQKLAEENIRRVAQAWEEMDIKLKGEYCTARFQYDTALKGREAAHQEHAEASQELEDAQRLMRQIYGKEHLHPFLYSVLIIFIAIFEVPLNSIVFDLFGEAKVLTYLFSGGLAIVIPTCAHFLGILLKREPLKRGFFNTEAVLLYLAIAVPIFVLAFIAYLREKFFEAIGAHKILGIEMDPTAVMITFFGINLLIFFVATLLSYFHHDPDIRQRRKELKQALENFEEEREEMARLTALVETTHRRYQAIRQMRENEWEHKRHEAIEIRNIIERLIQHYRKHNLRARKDSRQPKSFLTLPTIEIPRALQELSWDCSELRAEIAEPTLVNQEDGKR